MIEQRAAEVIGKVATTATYGGAGGAIFCGLTAYEIGVFGGLFIGLIGLVVKTAMTWHFKSKHLELAREAIKNGHAQIVMDGEET